MAETGYVYNTMAADFQKLKNSLIGLIVFTVRSSIQADFVDGIQDELQRRGHGLVIGNSHFDPNTELDLLRVFRQRRLTGVILAECTDDNRSELRELKKAGIPSVLTWEIPSDTSLDCVGFDNHQAAYNITKHLVDLGHRRIALIAGRFDRLERVRERLNGYSAALNDHKIPINRELIISRTPTPLDGKIAMSQLLSLPAPPTAVFAASDVFAFGAISAAKENGIRVPEDISICGWDDLDFAAYTDPPLTTVRVPTYEMGRRAADIVLRKSKSGTEDVSRVVLNTELIVRGSSGPPFSRVDVP
jgi:DNA-binding LacI/PurR family transcriptional regulator